jgi:predicted PurR-regulated permease PerM
MAKIEGRWIALLVITAAAVYLNWLMLVPFLGVIAWSAVLVILFYPLHRRILVRLNSPSWSALVSCLIVIFAFLIPITLLTLAVVNEASRLSDQVQAMQSSGYDLLDPNSPYTGKFVRWLGKYVDLNQLRSEGAITSRLRGVAGEIASRTFNLIGGLLGIVVQVFFIIFTMYYLFRDGDRILHALRALLPLSHDQATEVFNRTSDVISASVYGVIVIAGIQGTLGGFAFWVLGLSSPLLWGMVMMLSSMIPVLGSFIVWVPAAAYLALSGSYWKAIVLVLWGAVVIGSIDNFLRPKLVGGKAQLHELLIFFSVLGGLRVFGVLGIVLGPVVVAITLALIDVYRQANRPSDETRMEESVIEEQAELRSRG